VIDLPPLYAILDLDIADAGGLDPHTLCDAWLAAGVRLIQLRAKRLTAGPMLALATPLAARCHAAGARFIVNDRADIARLSGADGVHVGQDDLTPADARRIVGPSAIVGVSTHNHEQLHAAVLDPVDYLAIGPVFATASKERPDPTVGLDGVRRARAIADAHGRPLVAIGGITLESARDVVSAGAHSVAIISGLLDGDPAALAGRWSQAWNRWRAIP
jgi:thiamine-phosphate pyrophosphorylase